jgi:hypothetical protein
MSRQEVRNAVGNWIAQANITNLNQIFTAFPKRINFQQNSAPGQLTRAAGVVYINSEIESRIAVGGANSGWKRIDYEVEFQIYCHSMQNYAQDAMTDFDVIIDAVKDQLRSGGHRLGLSDGTTIWQAAEPGISVNYGEPLTNDGGAVEIWAAIVFTVTQMKQS